MLHDKYSRNFRRIFVGFSSRPQATSGTTMCFTSVGCRWSTALGIGVRAGLLVRRLLLWCHLDRFPILFCPLILESRTADKDRSRNGPAQTDSIGYCGLWGCDHAGNDAIDQGVLEVKFSSPQEGVPALAVAISRRFRNESERNPNA